MLSKLVLRFNVVPGVCPAIHAIRADGGEQEVYEDHGLL
jgi:hypothetical protein